MKEIDESKQTAQDASVQASLKKTTVQIHHPKAPIAPRWAALIGIVIIAILYIALPDQLTLGPTWLLPAIEGVLVALLLLTMVNDTYVTQKMRRYLALMLLGVVTIGLIGSIALLITTLPHNTKAINLLRSAALLWSSNIFVFALWYWEIDGGGPRKRHAANHEAIDFMFPQQVNGNNGRWAPHFLDYVFLAFNTTTAFSPTDTYPLTRPAKALMMIQSLISLIVIALLAARAINILS